MENSAHTTSGAGAGGSARVMATMAMSAAGQQHNAGLAETIRTLTGLFGEFAHSMGLAERMEKSKTGDATHILERADSAERRFHEIWQGANAVHSPSEMEAVRQSLHTVAGVDSGFTNSFIAGLSTNPMLNRESPANGDILQEFKTIRNTAVNAPVREISDPGAVAGFFSRMGSKYELLQARFKNAAKILHNEFNDGSIKPWLRFMAWAQAIPLIGKGLQKLFGAAPEVAVEIPPSSPVAAPEPEMAMAGAGKTKSNGPAGTAKETSPAVQTNAVTSTLEPATQAGQPRVIFKSAERFSGAWMKQKVAGLGLCFAGGVLVCLGCLGLFPGRDGPGMSR